MNNRTIQTGVYQLTHIIYEINLIYINVCDNYFRMHFIQVVEKDNYTKYPS